MRSVDRGMTDKPTGTYDCPVCGRAFPHGQDLHDFDQKICLAVLGSAFDALDHNARRLQAQGSRDVSDWGRTASSLRNMIPGPLAAKLHLAIMRGA